MSKEFDKKMIVNSETSSTAKWPTLVEDEERIN
jgi:hypothetical protein